MYAITIDGQTSYAAEIKYVRQVKGKWIFAPKDKAQAVFQAGKICNAKGFTQIEGLPYAAINKVDAGDILANLLNRLKAAVEKIEDAQEAICDLSVDVDGAVSDLQEAICDLSLEVSKS